MVAYLLETGGKAVGVLRPHRRQCAHHDEVEAALKDFDTVTSFTGHRSEGDTDSTAMSGEADPSNRAKP